MQKIYLTEELKIQSDSSGERECYIKRLIEAQLGQNRGDHFPDFEAWLSEENKKFIEGEISKLKICGIVPIEVGTISYSYPITITNWKIDNKNNIKVNLKSKTLIFDGINDEGLYSCSDAHQGYEFPLLENVIPTVFDPYARKG